jgi:hypothetical protein
VLHRNLGLAAAAVLTASASLAAAPTPARPGTNPQAAQQQAPTRAALLKGVDANFKAIDTNGDGTLNSAELGAAEGKVQQQRIAQIRGKLDAEFTKLDTNKNGSLDKNEFMAAAPNSSSATPNGAAIVTKLDANKDGRVSADEYRAPVLGTFDRMDTNHDGTLSTAERQAASKKK